MVNGAPVPPDPRIELREVPPAEYAVIRLSDFWSNVNCAEHLSDVAGSAAGRRSHDVEGTLVYARDDAAFIPWFLRRNEIWLRPGGLP